MQHSNLKKKIISGLLISSMVMMTLNINSFADVNSGNVYRNEIEDEAYNHELYENNMAYDDNSYENDVPIQNPERELFPERMLADIRNIDNNDDERISDMILDSYKTNLSNNVTGNQNELGPYTYYKLDEPNQQRYTDIVNQNIDLIESKMRNGIPANDGYLRTATALSLAELSNEFFKDIPKAIINVRNIVKNDFANHPEDVIKSLMLDLSTDSFNLIKSKAKNNLTAQKINVLNSFNSEQEGTIRQIKEKFLNSEVNAISVEELNNDFESLTNILNVYNQKFISIDKDLQEVYLPPHPNQVFKRLTNELLEVLLKLNSLNNELNQKIENHELSLNNENVNTLSIRNNNELNFNIQDAPTPIIVEHDTFNRDFLYSLDDMSRNEKIAYINRIINLCNDNEQLLRPENPNLLHQVGNENIVIDDITDDMINNSANSENGNNSSENSDNNSSGNYNPSDNGSNIPNINNNNDNTNNSTDNMPNINNNNSQNPGIGRENFGTGKGSSDGGRGGSSGGRGGSSGGRGGSGGGINAKTNLSANKNSSSNLKDTIGNWIKNKDDSWSFNSEGNLLKDAWILKNGNWFRIDNNAKLIERNWLKVGNSWFYAQDGGYIAENKWLNISNKWYYAKAGGYIVTEAWAKINDKWYYFNSNGEMLADTTVDGYKLSADGSMIK